MAIDGFDDWAEEICAPFFKEGGRPSIVPGVYFRMILAGYFEGLASERGIAWRCADSLSLREFLGMGLDEATPDHTSLSVWRKRLSLDVFRAVFVRVLEMVRAEGLLSTKALGIDASTMEANAAMKSIVRKATGDSYLGYVGKLAGEAGVEAQSAEEIRRFDKKRKEKKLSTADWESRTDPEARIAKMKDGTTRLAYKAEHAVALESSLLMAAEVHPAD
ncbi:MAG: transposase [Syntrophobacteraceae bacterium]